LRERVGAFDQPDLDQRHRIAMRRARAHPGLRGQFDAAAIDALGSEPAQQRQPPQQRLREPTVGRVPGRARSEHGRAADSVIETPPRSGSGIDPDVRS